MAYNVVFEAHSSAELYEIPDLHHPSNGPLSMSEIHANRNAIYDFMAWVLPEDHINLDVGDVCTRFVTQDNDKLVVSCDAVACIAGWIGWIADLNCPPQFNWTNYTHRKCFGDFGEPNYSTAGNRFDYTYRYAGELLGLEVNEMNKLFFPELPLTCAVCDRPFDVHSDVEGENCDIDLNCITVVAMADIPAAAVELVLLNLTNNGDVQWPAVYPDEIDY